MKLYIQEWEVWKNNMALREHNSNQDSTAGAVAIQMLLALDTRAPWAYRILHIDETTMASY